MPNWSTSMQQTFEYYLVDPGTWRDIRKLDNVISSEISWDSEADTLGSATIDVTESIGECYIRIYLITIQNGVKEKRPLGTFLVQTPSTEFDGKIKNISMDAYTPLIELKENPPDIGYYVPKETNVMAIAYHLANEHARAPVTRVNCDIKIHESNVFVAETDDTWLSYVKDLISIANYKFNLDEMGRIMFVPVQKLEAMQPVWTFNDDNSSILYPDITMKHDLFGIPNVVEVIYTEPTLKSGGNYHIIVENHDPSSPTSIESRGRKIVYRVTEPSFTGSSVTLEQIKDYAKRTLIDLSTIEYEISYTHGYCPVRVGDCVRLNYSRAGLENIKAKVISQSIKCKPGCYVSEKAVYSTSLINDKDLITMTSGGDKI